MVHDLLLARGVRFASLFLLVSLSLAGCTDDNPDMPGGPDGPGAPPPGQPPPGEPPPPPPPPPDHVRVVVDTLHPPELIAYREGTGAWKTPTATSQSKFEFDATGPYRVTTVCRDGSGGIIVYQAARTTNEQRAVTHACAPAVTPAVVEVTGELTHAGRVAIGTDQQVVGGLGGRFSLKVPRGTYDLVGASSDAIAIRRGVAVDPAGTPPVVNVGLFSAAAGAPLVVPNFVIFDGMTDAQRRAAVWIETGSTIARIFEGAPGLAPIAPDAVLRATDKQFVQISESKGDHELTVTRQFSEGGDRTTRMPKPLGPATFSIVSGTEDIFATWSTLPSFDRIQFRLAGPGLVHELTVGAGYVATTAATNAMLELTEIPAFRAEWGWDLAVQTASLSAIRVSGLGTATSTFKL